MKTINLLPLIAAVLFLVGALKFYQHNDTLGIAIYLVSGIIALIIFFSRYKSEAKSRKRK